MEPSSWKLMPDERVLEEYPWQAWCAGWAGVINGLLWIFSETVIKSPAGMNLFLKYLAFTPLFLLFAVGTWNLRKWGRIGLMATAAADLLVFALSRKGIIPPLDFFSILQLAERTWSFYLTAVAYLSGPVGDLVILAALAAGGSAFRENAAE